jgi:hypothetical protein
MPRAGPGVNDSRKHPNRRAGDRFHPRRRAIRRRAQGAFQLITQHDHGLLAGQLAERFGNARFARPDPLEPTLLATALHDGGWPIHDDQPTLNDDGLPLDVFEVGRHISLKVWTASADRAAERHPYAGLLTSLHVLSLSAYAMSQSQLRFAPGTPEAMRDRFEINRFQHQEIQRQQHLRDALGLSNDIPLTYGVPARGASAADDRLTFNFRLLQAMDLVSLAICCTTPPVEQSGELLTSPGGDAVRLTFGRPAFDELTVDPWPFDVAQPIGCHLCCRIVPAERFADQAAFRSAYAAAVVQNLSIRIRPL